MPFTWKTVPSVRLLGQALFPEKNEVRPGRGELTMTPPTAVSQGAGCVRIWGVVVVRRSPASADEPDSCLCSFVCKLEPPGCVPLKTVGQPVAVCVWLQIPAQLELPLGDLA